MYSMDGNGVWCLFVYDEVKSNRASQGVGGFQL